MRLEARLNKLEQQAAKLPPDGATLQRQLERIPPGPAQEAWLSLRTDEELEARAIASLWGNPVGTMSYQITRFHHCAYKSNACIT